MNTLFTREASSGCSEDTLAAVLVPWQSQYSGQFRIRLLYLQLSMPNTHLMECMVQVLKLKSIQADLSWSFLLERYQKFSFTCIIGTTEVSGFFLLIKHVTDM